MLFDEIIEYDFSQDIAVLRNLIEKYIQDPQKTRFVTNSDCS